MHDVTIARANCATTQQKTKPSLSYQRPLLPDRWAAAIMARVRSAMIARGQAHVAALTDHGNQPIPWLVLHDHEGFGTPSSVGQREDALDRPLFVLCGRSGGGLPHPPPHTKHHRSRARPPSTAARNRHVKRACLCLRTVLVLDQEENTASARHEATSCPAVAATCGAWA